MVIVEGPDGAGKTTLVNGLAEKYSLRVGNRGTSNRDELYKVTVSDTFRALARAAKSMGRTDNLPGLFSPNIWDRLFFSEFVYHPFMDRPCQFNEAQKQFVVSMLNALRCPIILCLPSLDRVIQNSQAAHQMEGVNENIGAIYQRYVVQSNNWWPTHYSLYDYTNEGDLDRINSIVESYLTRRKEREWLSR